MQGVQKIAMLIAITGLVTTLILPRRQTPQVIDSFGRLVTRAQGTAMGTSTPRAY